MKRIEDYIIAVPDFPKPGIIFQDITGILSDPDGLKLTLDAFYKALENAEFDVVVGLEARGFLFGVPIAEHFHKPFVPERKKGKLPFSEGDLVAVDIVKEYGKDQVFYRLSDLAAGKPEGDIIPLTLFDDILATGGTARGIAESLNKQKVTVDGKEYQLKITDFVFLVEIDDLPGRSIIEKIAPVKALMHVTEN